MKEPVPKNHEDKSMMNGAVFKLHSTLMGIKALYNAAHRIHIGVRSYYTEFQVATTSHTSHTSHTFTHITHIHTLTAKASALVNQAGVQLDT